MEKNVKTSRGQRSSMNLSSIEPIQLKPLRVVYELLKQDWLDQLQLLTHRADIEKEVFKDRIKELYKKEKPEGTTSWKDLSYAMRLYLDTLADPTTVERNKDKLNKKDRRILDVALNLSPEARNLALDIAKEFRIFGELAKEEGVIRNTVENYIDHLWDLPKNMTATEFWRKFSTTTSHSKRRKLKTILDGLGEGYKLKVKGLAEGLAIVKKTIYPVIENKKLIETGLNTEGEEGKKLFYTYKPKGADYEMIKHPLFIKWRKVGKIKSITKQMKADNDIIVLDDHTILKKERIYAPKPIAINLNKQLKNNLKIYRRRKVKPIAKKNKKSISKFFKYNLHKKNILKVNNMSTKKILLISASFFLAFYIAISVYFTSFIGNQYEIENKYNSLFGRHYLLTVIDYSIWRQTFTLSNGKKVNIILLSKLKKRN